jgi:hypothetical protein
MGFRNFAFKRIGKKASSDHSRNAIPSGTGPGLERSSSQFERALLDRHETEIERKYELVE